MKSVILIACLIISAAAEPQKTAGLERESPKKSDKLQFSPGDAQIYSGSVAQQVVPFNMEPVLAAGNVVYPQVAGIAPQVIPGYYAAGASVIPGVNQVYPAGYQAGIVPYSTAGKTTVTSTSQNGLPTGTVWEHQGTSHIGHQANAVHVKKPGQLYAPSAYYPSTAAHHVGAAGLAVPNAAWPAGQSSWSSASSYYNGQVQYINGQPAQYLNGQWYAVSSAIPQQHHQQYAPSGYSTNLVNRANVLPQHHQQTLYPQNLYPQHLYQQTLANDRRVQIQPGTSYTQSVVGVRPANDNKWYTKTNTQQVVQPFYGQPQYSQIPSAAGAKSYAVPKPDVEVGEKADW